MLLYINVLLEFVFLIVVCGVLFVDCCMTLRLHICCVNLVYCEENFTIQI